MVKVIWYMLYRIHIVDNSGEDPALIIMGAAWKKVLLLNILLATLGRFVKLNKIVQLAPWKSYCAPVVGRLTESSWLI